MLFNSIHYLFFFPLVVLIYFIVPKKFKMYWLLAVSYYFYMSWNAKYGLLLLSSTIITYLCGLALERTKEMSAGGGQGLVKKWIIILSLIINFGALFYYKYANFFINNINSLFKKLAFSIQYQNLDILLPVGISFFIFQAAGYTIDVYRNEICAEKDFFRYALFVSFFPQLVAGPIERSKHLLTQLYKEDISFDVRRVKDGLLTMAYGLFMKIVVADNVAAAIDPIFKAPDNYSGMVCLFAVVLFAVQIYCDFDGYTQIAIGSARVLGIELNENFDTPYLGVSVKDFWKRWHISLTSWFRDYLYIPLGGSRNGTIRKYINTIIVFLCSGLWHGAAWHYVAWGGLNGIYCVMEDIIQKWNRPFFQKDLFVQHVLQRMITFILIDITWIFFRATSFRTALHILEKIIVDFNIAWMINFGFVNTFKDSYTLAVVMTSIFIVLMVDIAKYYGKDIKAFIFEQRLLSRWIIYAGILLVILFWGNYGTGHGQADFIYFQF